MNKKILLSLVIIAVLGTVLYFKNKKYEPEYNKILTTWQEGVDEVVINKPDNTNLKMIKDADKWLVGVESYPADKDRAEGIINKIKDLNIIDLVSEKKFYSKYDLTPDKAIIVKILKSGQTVREVMFGKKSSTNRHTYVRINQKPEVYLIAGSFEHEFNKTVDELRDKEIFKADKESINSLELTYKGRKYSLYQKLPDKLVPPKDPKDPSKDKAPEPEWKCQGYEKIKLSKSKVDSIISSFNPVKAESYPNLKKESLKRSLCSLKFQALGKNIELNIHYQDKEKKYIATCSESPYVFTLSEWKAKKYFIKSIKDLKDN